MNATRDLVPIREAAARLDTTVDALRARVRRGSIEAHKESAPPYRWLVAVPAGDQDTDRADVDAAARSAALETDAAALRTEVAGLRTSNADLRAALDHERAQAGRVTRTLERLTLALPGPPAAPRRRRWPWQREAR